ncbi:tyrosine-protein kinase HTK16-like [Haliotis rufescens]|uniref:tyrosine-protein kinase HTK16-like n=1 Tax=Haliotis rufescens TaxID=6454 RepID=UPI00201EA8C8|nr:tyrosine-protein kinase HTK16-like [Haliotis rufescens]
MNERDAIHDGTVYANSDILKTANVSKLLLSGKPLEQLLSEDHREVAKADENNVWYHKKISRESAESILQEGLQKQGDMSGLFLIRDSTVSGNDFALSLVCKGKIFHFQVQQTCECFYRIDDGPIIHGLDKLVTHYTGMANGLPTKLSSFCRGSIPPNTCRKFGPNNLLHRAVLEGKKDVVKRILAYSTCPDVNAKNKIGSLALHDAAFHGYYEIVAQLLDRGADVKIKDTNGHTALHRACVANQPRVVELLIKKGRSLTSERCSQTGWVPLHEAAMRGHINCIKVLLENDATPFPRNDDKLTPLELAKTYGRRECINHFKNYEIHDMETKPADWFHAELDRQGAMQMFEFHGMREGLFLIRPSKKHFGWHVLSLCHSRAAFNYEIRNQDYEGRLVHFIDDGPYLLSLEHVVYHYTRQMDGLPCMLTASLNSTQRVIEVIVPRAHTSDNSYPRPISQPDPPGLPPRPTDDLYSAPNKNNPTTPDPVTPPVPAGPIPNRKPADAEPQQTNLTMIPLSKIKRGSELGQGEYGSVLKGTLITHKGTFRSEKIDVALKTFHDGSVENANSFLAEARVMQSLQHACILSLLGVCEGPPLMLVEEYVPMGSMLDFLLDHEEKIDVKTDLYLWAAQIANGMKYLETQRLVHRDLAARNILLKDMKQIKISDFGLSRAVGTESDYYKATHGGRWPIKWYAPESVNYGQFSHASDVWSYGVTLWEMFTFGEPPYGEMKGIEVVQYIEHGKRLIKPDRCPQTAYGIMLKCWSWKAEHRPQFMDLAKHFDEDPEYASIHDLLRQASRRE